jgi:hypothetical protein
MGFFKYGSNTNNLIFFIFHNLLVDDGIDLEYITSLSLMVDIISTLTFNSMKRCCFTLLYTISSLLTAVNETQITSHPLNIFINFDSSVLELMRCEEILNNDDKHFTNKITCGTKIVLTVFSF